MVTICVDLWSRFIYNVGKAGSLLGNRHIIETLKLHLFIPKQVALSFLCRLCFFGFMNHQVFDGYQIYCWSFVQK